MSSIVVTVDRTNTVSVTRNAPNLTTVVETSAVTAISNPEPVVTEVERGDAGVDLVYAGQQGPRGAQGVAGPEGGTSETRVAAAVLGGHRLVRSVSASEVGYADPSDPTHGDDTLGLTLGAAAAGADVQVQRTGQVVHAGWAWTPGEPVFLGPAGVPTQSPAAEAAFEQVIGYAEDATTLNLRIEPPVYAED